MLSDCVFVKVVMWNVGIALLLHLVPLGLFVLNCEEASETIQTESTSTDPNGVAGAEQKKKRIRLYR